MYNTGKSTGEKNQTKPTNQTKAKKNPPTKRKLKKLFALLESPQEMVIVIRLLT